LGRTVVFGLCTKKTYKTYKTFFKNLGFFPALTQYRVRTTHNPTIVSQLNRVDPQ